MEQKRAYLSKGGKNLSNNSGTVKQQDKPASKSATTTGATSELVVSDVIAMARNRQIPIDRAASIITGRIRHTFVDAIRNNKENTSEFGFELDSFKYLDHIMFDDIISILESVMKFGSAYIPIKYNDIIKMITNTARMIEYYIPEKDYEIIRAALIEVYAAF